MRWTAIVLTLAWVAPAAAQEFPTPTEAGTKALDEFIRRCVTEGGLKDEKAPKTGASVLTVADPAKLKATVAAERASWGPELRNALIDRWKSVSGETESAICALLRLAGEVSGDGIASAFAAYFTAAGEKGRGNPAAVIARLEAAAEQFRVCGEPAWQAGSLNEVGGIYYTQANHAKALEFFQKALAIRRAALGERHPDVASSYNNIGVIHVERGEPAQALESYEKSLAIRRAVLGERHPDVANSYNNLANAYTALGEPAKALESHQKALAIERAALGERHPNVASSYYNIARAYTTLHDPSQALENFQKALAIWRASRGERHPSVASCYNGIGVSHVALGAPARALESHQKALTIRLAALGEQHLDVAQSYHNLAIAYRDLDEPARALEQDQKALAIRRAALGERHPDVAMSDANIGSDYYALGNPAQALEYGQKALTIRREVLGEHHLDVAASYNHIAAASTVLGELAQARESFQKALAIQRAVLGERHPLVADGYNNLAVISAQMGEPARALESFQEALAIRRAVLGERHLDVANSYNNLAVAYADLGEPAQDLEYSRKALEIRRAALGERHPDVATSYANIAIAYRLLGDLVQALEYGQKALAIQRAALGERHLDVASSYNTIAAVFMDRGEPAQALESYQKELAIRRAVLGERHHLVAATFDDMAAAYAELGEPARALKSFQETLAIRRAALGERHPDVARSCDHIAAAYLTLDEPARALEYGQQALAIRSATQGERHPDVAFTYNNIAGAYHELGDLARARESYRKALAIWRVALGERHPLVAACDYNIAGVCADLGDRSQAREALGQALLALHEDERTGPGAAPLLADRRRPSLLTVQVLLARGRQFEDDRSRDPSAARAALSDYLAAAEILERLRGRGDHASRGEVLAADRLHLGEQASALAPRTIGVAARLADAEHRPEHLSTALDAAERGAARVFLQDLGRAHAHAVGRVEPALRAEEAALATHLNQLDVRLDKEQSRPPEKRDRETVTRLLGERSEVEQRKAELVARMERVFPQYAALKYPRPCTVEQALACLGDDEVALHYVLGAEASYLLVLEKRPATGTIGITVHRLPPRNQIAELVAALTQTKVLEDQDAALERGTEAYRMLLAPAADALAGKHLVIVPGGALGGLPFELLAEPDGAGGERFLVKQHRIRYAPSLTALHFVGLWDRERRTPERPLWALGDPTYEPGDRRLAANAEPSEEAQVTRMRLDRGTRGAALRRLPFSGAEVERLRAELGATRDDIMLGPAATEVAVKALSRDGTLARYRHVHFACHGVLGLADGTPPGLVLAQAVDQHGEDGYLRLDEVADLRLNADLVVLSACQSGQGTQYRAEGVGSLGRAFLYAGCRAVLCSLWQVDDTATADLMVDVYQGLKAGRPAAEALRAAQLKMIEDGQPPLYWAPFILIGR